MNKLLFVFLLLPLLSFGQLSRDQQSKVDSIRSVIRVAKHDSIIIKGWMDWDYLIYRVDPELDFQLMTKVDSLCSINLKKKLKKDEKLFFQESAAFTYNSLGVIYTEQGNYSEAIKNYTNALRIYEKLEQKKNIAKCLGNIGVIYYDQSNFEKAMEYSTRCLKMQQELGNKAAVAGSLSNIGNIYSSQDDIPTSLEYHKQSLAIAEEINHQQAIPRYLNSVGNAYSQLGEYAKAMVYLNKSLDISIPSNDRRNMCNSFLKMGTIYFEQKNFTKSIEYNKKALLIAQEVRHPQIIREASNTLFKIYKNTGRYKESLDMHELYTATRDSIISDENRQETIRQEFSYQYEKRTDSLAIEQRKKDELTKAKQQQKEDISRRENEKKNIVIAFVLGGLILVMIFTFYTIKRLRVTRKQKVIIEEQKNEVEKSQRETHEQKQILEEAHNEITGSIQYAKRLQDALLPSYNQLTDMLPDSFIFFKPKDVVSGDFYWCEQFNDSIYFAVADCTGHGVPGALVSVVCSNALNRSVREFGIQEPSKILDKTRQLVIEAFAKSGDAVKDGMDISLCSFKVVSEDQSVDKVIFSGANNPLWIIRKNEYLTESELTARSTLQRDSVSLIEFKGDKQPIGLDDRMSNFSQQEVELFPGDAIYLFSDGFADQFGGENGKKLKYKPFKLLLLQMHAHTGAQQSKKLADFFHEWKGDLEQVDDVCVVGVKVNP